MAHGCLAANTVVRTSWVYVHSAAATAEEASSVLGCVCKNVVFAALPQAFPQTYHSTCTYLGVISGAGHPAAAAGTTATRRTWRSSSSPLLLKGIMMMMLLTALPLSAWRGSSETRDITNQTKKHNCCLYHSWSGSHDRSSGGVT